MIRCLKNTALLFLYVFIQVVNGQEGNYKLENYGNQSALLTGNVTASVSDLALTYYNPSKLSFMEESKFLISIKAYQWDQFSYKNNYGEGKTVNDSEFNGIPSMVAGEFTLDFLPNHKFAYSLISRYRSDINLVYESGIVEEGEVGGVEDTEAALINIDIGTKIKDEWFGLTWAHKLTDNFSVGASAFFSIYQFREKGELLISGLQTTGDVALLANRLNYEQNAYGLFLKLGMTYNVSNIELGANISLPYLGIRSDASILIQELTGGLGPDEDSFELYDIEGLKSQRKTALGIAVGAGILIGNSKIHLNAEWYSKVDEYERITLPDELIDDNTSQSNFNEEFKSVINFGVGTDLYLSPSVSLILSASSDFSAHVSSLNLLDELNEDEANINVLGDFWHLGIGTDLSIKWGNIYTGIVYSATSSNINTNPDFVPDDIEDTIEGALGGIDYQRIRVIIGIDLPLIKKELEKKLEKIQNSKEQETIE